MWWLFIVTEHYGNIFINEEPVKKRFEFIDQPSYILWSCKNVYFPVFGWTLDGCLYRTHPSLTLSLRLVWVDLDKSYVPLTVLRHWAYRVRKLVGVYDECKLSEMGCWFLLADIWISTLHWQWWGCLDKSTYCALNESYSRKTSTFLVHPEKLIVGIWW